MSEWIYGYAINTYPQKPQEHFKLWKFLRRRKSSPFQNATAWWFIYVKYLPTRAHVVVILPNNPSPLPTSQPLQLKRHLLPWLYHLQGCHSAFFPQTYVTSLLFPSEDKLCCLETLLTVYRHLTLSTCPFHLRSTTGRNNGSLQESQRCTFCITNSPSKASLTDT